ncbi:hypothetical protein K438DRAFT_1847787 [Mycena galopus ATCC 62051]|nr:hypothetical protein K438DRAFT_1847787 [Mycena galopus ATCC 62051]
MPALQTSSSALALSSSSIVVIVILLLLVLGGSAGYFFVVPCVRRAVKERRARTKDVENSTSILIRYPLEKVKKAAAAAVLAKARAGLPITLKRSVPVRKVLGGITACRQFSRLAEGFDGSTRFGASRTRTRPGPSPLRAVTLAPEPAVAAAAFDPKKADAASHLVTARIRLAVNAKKAGAVIGQSPFGAVRKTVVTTRPHLQSLMIGEVRTRFGISTRAMPGPSPLRRVCATLQSEESESTSTIEKPTVVHEAQVPEARTPHKHERCPTFIGWTAGTAQSKGKGKALGGSSNAGTGGRSRGSAKGGRTSTSSEKGINNGRGKDKENQVALLRVLPRPSPRPSPLRRRI